MQVQYKDVGDWDGVNEGKPPDGVDVGVDVGYKDGVLHGINVGSVDGVKLGNDAGEVLGTVDGVVLGITSRRSELEQQ